MDERLKQQIDFVIEIDKLKTIQRQTLLIDRSRRENDAEHSWHFALMAWLLKEYAPEGVNIDRVIRMALIHDLVEIVAGDVSAFDAAGNEGKEEREMKAADQLFSKLPPDQAKEYRALWEEFDAMQTADAQYASAIDRLQPFLHNVKTEGHTWVKWGVNREQALRRIGIVEEGAPGLWQMTLDIIDWAVQKGYIRHE